MRLYQLQIVVIVIGVAFAAAVAALGSPSKRVREMCAAQRTDEITQAVCLPR